MKLRRTAGIAVAVGVVCAVAGCAASPRGFHAGPHVPVAADGLTAQDPRAASLSSGMARHYEYVFPDGAMYVYDIDHGHRRVQRVRLPGVKGVRGVAASPRTHMLYISYGAFGGPGTAGRLLAYNLLAGSVAYDRSYSRGIDNMAIDPAGDRIYMPDGESSRDGVWSVIAARSGNVIGSINGGTSPHETVVGVSGKRVYLGGRNWPYLEVASTATDRVFRRIGPLKSGVRPFTINGRETIAYTTATGLLGFQVSSVTTGRVLFTIGFGSRFPLNRATFPFSAPSHGISLTPNERQLWGARRPERPCARLRRKPGAAAPAETNCGHQACPLIDRRWLDSGQPQRMLCLRRGFGRRAQRQEPPAGRFPARTPQHQGVARDRLAPRTAGGDQHALRAWVRDARA